ncbi:unnamed protein product [Candida verbasci]|uniref:SPX domain-containing protein n=1 Tax=Candida verbasci TaxID=1227364 RepID=A0A9W4TWD7_9ASCO|nr:unnamed protein product [Candida verbasci]
MKFSHSLKFNAVPEWRDDYLNYPTLKKIIYKLQQEQIEHNGDQTQGFIVGTNTTTISELVEHFKDSNYSKNSVVIGSSSSKTNLKKRITKNLFNKFKRQNKSSDSDLELLEIHTVHEDSDSNDKKTKSSNEIESFDIENSSIEASTSNLIQDIIDKDDESYSNSKSMTFDPLKAFTKYLLIELNKINKFYQAKEKEVSKNYEHLITDLKKNNVDIDEVFKSTNAYEFAHHRKFSDTVFEDHVGTSASTDLEKQGDYHYQVQEDDSEDDEDYHSQDSVLLNHTDFNVKTQLKVALKRKAVSLFINLSELKSFIELNRIGFTKICKKFDKICNYSVKQDFIDNFLPNNSKVFEHATIQSLEQKLDTIVKIYAFLIGSVTIKTTKEDLESVKNELKSNLRDHIVFERNTVWKDLLSIEKKSYNLDLDNAATQNNKMGDEANATSSMLYMQMKEIKIWKTNKVISLPAFLFTIQMVKILITVIAFVILISIKTLNDPVEGRALAVLVACIILFATEAIPLYATGIFIPLLCVTCRIVKDNDTGKVMDATSASKYILGTMWNSTIMILIGGFTLAAALSKYNIAKIAASWILAFAGTKPRNVILAMMSLSLFLSMWISNVATPVLCYSLLQPLLRTLPTDSDTAKALVLCIAFSSGLAGMSSPIASPQNVIGITYMSPNPGWGNWFAVALPVSIIAMIIIWLELIFTFKVNKVKLQKFKPIKDRWTVKQIFVLLVTIVTIILWCVESKIEGTFGESGIISVIPFVLFFGSGLLKVDDLNMYPWNIVLLASGGIALGKALTASELLKTVAESLEKKIMDYGAFLIMFIFGALVLVISTFISHTVAALIIVPLILEVGQSLGAHTNLLIMGVALGCSSGMGLPSSGFPNMTAVGLRDPVGKPYITVNTLMTRGIPASIITFLVIVTVGYGIMSSLGL